MTVKKPSLFLLFSLLFLPVQALASDPEIPNPGPRSNAEATGLFERGNQFFAKKDFDASIRNLKRFLERYPSHEHANEAYLYLVESYSSTKQFPLVIKYGKEFLGRNPDLLSQNRTKVLIAESYLNLKDYLQAKVVSDELLKSNPDSKQKATAYSIKFQSLLEEKQYSLAQAQYDALSSLLQSDAIDSFVRLLPEFRMTLEMRKCTTSHLLKNKQFSGLDDEDGPQFNEEELTEYFSKKNLCFKSALPEALKVYNKEVIHEWCESFTNLNHEIEKLRIDPFLKQKISKELKTTFEFSKTLNPDLSKCYEPYKTPKTKKRYRKRRVHPS
jgi:tetratricopeptide (TPR) repeat protein